MSGGLALVVGGGNVGVGVMLRLLRSAGYDVTMVTRRDRDAERLQRHGARVQLTGASHARLQLSPCPAVAAGDLRCVTELVRVASLAVVAVRPHQLADVAALLAPGLSRRRRPINVLVCDNRPRAGTLLAREVARAGAETTTLQHGFVATLLDQIATSRSDERGQLIHVETKGRLFLDAPALRADPPVLAGSLLVEDHPAYVLRKLFLFSAGHTAAAFVGRLRPHTLMSEALADPLVANVVLAALGEARAGLEHCYGARFSGAEDAVGDFLTRYADPDLADTLARVARDPGRKLVADDRVCGPARLALASGVPVPAMALVGAAGLCAHQTELVGRPFPAGVSASDGAALMSWVSGLAPRHPFAQASGAAYAALSHRDLEDVVQDLRLRTGDVGPSRRDGRRRGRRR